MTKIKKGLFIGIDYLGSSNRLYNCRNDAKDMMKIINDRFGISNTILLVDDADDDKKPTKANIIKWLRWLSEGNLYGDNLWLHYSGHGGYKRDLSGDEKDGYDETMIPIDFQINGQILDDDINRLVCRPIVESGANLYFHDDCCHSGTAADLKYRMIESEIKDNVVGVELYEYNTPSYNQYNTPSYNQYNTPSYNQYNTPSYNQYNTPSYNQYYVSSYNQFHNQYNPFTYLLNYYMNLFFRDIDKRTYDNNNSRGKFLSKSHKSRDEKNGTVWEIKENGYTTLNGTGRVIKWSGCMDDQTSSDGFNGMANGAMTGSVITVLNDTSVITWGDFLLRIRKLLKDYEQIPQLCFNQKLDHTDKCFDL